MAGWELRLLLFHWHAFQHYSRPNVATCIREGHHGSFQSQFVEDKNKKTHLTFPIIFNQIFYHSLLQSWTYYTATVYSNFLATTRCNIGSSHYCDRICKTTLRLNLFFFYIIFWLMFLYFRWWVLCCGVLGCDCIKRKVLKIIPKWLLCWIMNNN